MKKVGAIFMILALAVSSVLASAEEKELDYPELSVVPRTSDRLLMEAPKEPSYQWTAFLPIQISGLATALAGASHMNPFAPVNAWIGEGTGLATIIVGTVFMLTSHPLTDAAAEIKPLGGQSTRDKLTRERFAEIALNNASRQMNILRFSVSLVNAGVGTFLLLGRNSVMDSYVMTQTIADAAAILLSLGPIVFAHPAIRIAEEQRDFKGRVYAPVASTGVLPTPDGKSLAPAALLSWRF